MTGGCGHIDYRMNPDNRRIMPPNSDHRARRSRDNPWRVAVFLWSSAALVAWLAPWPYAVGSILFVTFLHLTLLENPGQPKPRTVVRAMQRNRRK
ncbi:MAG: hypothetical protein AAF993_18890 [Pseudomonadota bacterium]